MRVKKAIIPAAGWGLRFLPATKAQPKEMLPIVDKPTIQYIIEEAVASGIEAIVIVTGKNKRAIEDHFDRATEMEMLLREKGDVDRLQIIEEIANLADIYYIRQKEAKGLGHAIYCARDFIGNEPFAVLLGDDLIEAEVPCLQQMMDVFAETGHNILAVQEVPRSRVSRYGVIQPAAGSDSLYQVEDLVEKPAPEEAPSNLAVVGRYILRPEIFDILAETPPGRGGEIQLTDALRVLCRQQPMSAYQFTGRRYDIGDKLGFLQATVDFALRRSDVAQGFVQYLRQVVANLPPEGIEGEENS